MAAPDLAHADPEVLRQAAATAGNVADGIEQILGDLQVTVNTLTSRWLGTAPVAFMDAYQEWNNKVRVLTASLNELGGNTGIAANRHQEADQSGAGYVTAALAE